MKKNISILFTFFSIVALNAQQAIVYPTHWWTGMKYNKVQLLLHTDADHIFPDKMALSINHTGIKVGKITHFKNKRYLTVDIEIAASTKPSKTSINVITIAPREGFTIPFEIKPRRKGNGTLYAQGLTSADVQYLIMPDRFSNGDPTNDRVPGMLDQSLRRDTVFNRHGGDLKGIENHLDYLKDLGITALWLNPVLENDMPNRTEHGYAFTDHYKIERRIGGEAAYQQLIDKAHAKNLKVIQDAVYNHIGSEHVLFKDMPDSSWFHWWPRYTNTTYKDQAIFDPNGSIIDKKQMTDGWFVPSMPDWNHNNINVEKFLIQHALWTVEEFGIDAWRIDTYAYNDLDFMNRCNKALIDEYPKIFMFGETWVHGVPNQSYFTANNYNIPYKSNLHSVTDFQTLWGIKDAMTKDFGWTDGVNKLYTILAQDFVYKNAANNVVFLDNHDINRFYSEVGEDKAKYIMSLGWLLTTRGIPQLYYGSEIGMTGFTSPNDGYVRQDFPGGWEGDKVNKFEASGRTDKEHSIFNYIKTLANYRKNSKALTIGKFTQYVPVDAVYVYFRTYKNETIMVVMNTGKEKKEFALDRFAQHLQSKQQMKDIITNKSTTLPSSLSVEPQSILIAELK